MTGRNPGTQMDLRRIVSSENGSRRRREKRCDQSCEEGIQDLLLLHDIEKLSSCRICRICSPNLIDEECVVSCCVPCGSNVFPASSSLIARCFRVTFPPFHSPEDAARGLVQTVRNCFRDFISHQSLARSTPRRLHTPLWPRPDPAFSPPCSPSPSHASRPSRRSTGHRRTSSRSR